MEMFHYQYHRILQLQEQLHSAIIFDRILIVTDLAARSKETKNKEKEDKNRKEVKRNKKIRNNQKK